MVLEECDRLLRDVDLRDRVTKTIRQFTSQVAAEVILMKAQTIQTPAAADA